MFSLLIGPSPIQCWISKNSVCLGVPLNFWMAEEHFLYTNQHHSWRGMRKGSNNWPTTDASQQLTTVTRLVVKLFSTIINMLSFQLILVSIVATTGRNLSKDIYKCNFSSIPSNVNFGSSCTNSVCKWYQCYYMREIVRNLRIKKNKIAILPRRFLLYIEDSFKCVRNCWYIMQLALNVLSTIAHW